MNNTYEYQLILKLNNHQQEKTTLIIHIPIQNLNNKNTKPTLTQNSPTQQPSTTSTPNILIQNLNKNILKKTVISHSHNLNTTILNQNLSVEEQMNPRCNKKTPNKIINKQTTPQQKFDAQKRSTLHTRPS